jgi:hypothetical protein
VSATTPEQLLASADRLDAWLVRNDFKAYDPFDGLSSRLLRPLTFNSAKLRIALQQCVRRFPLNLRPLVGVPRDHSSKGMGFLARGYMRLHAATGDERWAERARSCLDWLFENRSPGWSGAAWGNHFDYQSRVFYLPAGVPTIVWVSLIGQALLDAHAHFGERGYLDLAASACEHILHDLDLHEDGDTACISYIPIDNKQVHNANVLGAGLLARVYALTGNEAYRDLAARAAAYTVKYQRPDASWWYGEADNLHWVDNFHTAYVLDSLKHYAEGSGDRSHDDAVDRGYRYWKETFFEPDGMPRYYDVQAKPLDIQCCSQAVDTLVFFNDRDPGSLELARRVAGWTIANMQDRDGHFWFRRYPGGWINKTATLHWGQATMLCALGGLYRALTADGSV